MERVLNKDARWQLLAGQANTQGKNPCQPNSCPYHFYLRALPDIWNDLLNGFPQDLAALLLELGILGSALLQVLPDLKGLCGRQVGMEGVFAFGCQAWVHH